MMGGGSLLVIAMVVMMVVMCVGMIGGAAWAIFRRGRPRSPR